MRHFANSVGNVSTIFEKVVIFIVQFGVGALILDLNISVLFRYVFKVQLVGTSEIALFLMAWITFLGACLSIKQGSMVAITFVLDKFHGWFATAIQMMIQLLILFFSVILFYYSFMWITAPNVQSTMSSALQIPMWIPYSIIPLSMFITVIFCINNMIQLVIPPMSSSIGQHTKNQEELEG
jgi:TRAP-type C4-dicarboxylate transport system permease small subunit